MSLYTLDHNILISMINILLEYYHVSQLKVIVASYIMRLRTMWLQYIIL